MNLKIDIATIQGILLSLIVNSNILYIFNFPPGIINGLVILLLFVVFIYNYKGYYCTASNPFIIPLSFIFLHGAISLLLIPSFYSLLIFLKLMIIVITGIIAANQSIKSISVFLKSTIFLNIILAIISVADISFVFSNDTVNYLTITYALGASFIISFINSIISNDKKMFWSLTAIFLLIAILLYPSRGTSIFSLLVCLLFLLFISRNSLKSITILFISTFAFLLISIWIWNHLLSNTYLAYRYIELVTHTENEPRLELYAKVWESIKNNWLVGVGVGNSGITFLKQQDAYPHNVFLEAWLEYGIVGLIAFASLIALLFKNSIKALKLSKMGIILFFLFVYGILNFQKSFSLKYSQFYIIFPCLSISLLKNHDDDNNFSYNNLQK